MLIILSLYLRDKGWIPLGGSKNKKGLLDIIIELDSNTYFLLLKEFDNEKWQKL